MSHVDQEARDWLVKMGTGSVTAAERRAFEAWRDADPAHAAAYRKVERLWDQLAQWRELEVLEPLDRLSWRERWQMWREQLRERQRPIRLLPAAAAVAALVALAFPAVQQMLRAADFHTETAQIADVTLPDGSRVTLGAESAIDERFTGKERRVALLRGEAFFNVSKDAARPFVVMIGDTAVRAVGTAFNVRRTGGTVRVDVSEGVVAVSRPGDVKSERRLTAGQRLTVAPARPLAQLQPAPTPVKDVAAWRQGRLVYYGAPLHEVVADANRYYNGEIVIADPSLADLQLTAAFRSDEIEKLVLTVAEALPVIVIREDGGRLVLLADPQRAGKKI